MNQRAGHIEVLRIGTRKSPLALAQSRLVADALCLRHMGLKVELVPIVTSGDRHRGSLQAAGGKGLFTVELESALREGRIDLAVHSAKDLPAVMADDLTIAATPAREDPRDALISPGGATVASLKSGAVVATSSPRRGSQLAALRGDVRIVPIRGNVDTRLRKALDGGRIDATILAMAGLIRAGLLELHRRHVCPMNVDEFIPAAGQGALAVQSAKANTIATELAAALDDHISRQALEAERLVVRHLDADCHSSLAVHFRRSATGWDALLWASRPDGSGACPRKLAAANAPVCAQELIRLALADGVDKLLKNC